MENAVPNGYTVSQDAWERGGSNTTFTNNYTVAEKKTNDWNCVIAKCNMLKNLYGSNKFFFRIRFKTMPPLDFGFYIGIGPK